jgi:phosphate transporter
MIGRERRGEGGTLLGASVDTTEEKAFEVHTRVGRVRLSRRKAWIVISALIFVMLLNMTIVEGDEANRCLAVLVFATLLWATEVRQSSSLLPGRVLSQSSRLYHYS